MPLRIYSHTCVPVSVVESVCLYVADVGACVLARGDPGDTSSDADWWERRECSTNHAAVGHKNLLPRRTAGVNGSSCEHCARDRTHERCLTCTTTHAGQLCIPYCVVTCPLTQLLPHVVAFSDDDISPFICLSPCVKPATLCAAVAARANRPLITRQLAGCRHVHCGHSALTGAGA